LKERVEIPLPGGFVDAARLLLVDVLPFELLDASTAPSQVSSQLEGGETYHASAVSLTVLCVPTG
jgi:hypothetical protein